MSDRVDSLLFFAIIRFIVTCAIASLRSTKLRRADAVFRSNLPALFHNNLLMARLLLRA
jgi:hypothetical protein